MQNVDLSGTMQNIFQFLSDAISKMLDFLGHVYIFPNVSFLHFLIALVILGMIISAVFVLFEGGVDDD